MKILMLTDKMDVGGAETHIFSLISSLSQKGHKVTLVSSGGSLAEKLLGSGVRHISLPLSSKTPKSLALSYIRLSRLLRAKSFDVIHSHSRITSLLSAKLAKKHRIPLICTAHARFSVSSYRKYLSRWGTLSIAVSQDLKQYLIDNYSVAPENIEVIPNGIDLSLFKHSPRLCASECLRIGFLSRLDADCSDAAYLLCSIAEKLCSLLGKIQILIGGGGTEHDDISALAQKVNDGLGFECIKICGAISDTPSFFNSCDIFVGVSRAAMEASLCGLPVILCGNEGYFGILTSDNLNDARISNFCARGYPSMSAYILLRDIQKVILMKPQEVASVSSIMRGEFDLERIVEKTLTAYSRAISMIPCRKSSVLLCGYYGFGNMGDNALLRSSIKRAREEFPSLPIGALTKSGARDCSEFGIRCTKRSSAIGVIRELRGCEHFIFGGGTLLQDSTSLRSLLYYVCIMRLAKLCGAKCHIWGNGIGELSSPLSKHLVKRALDCCDYIGLRDEHSFKMAKELSSNTRIYKESDLALHSQPSDTERTSYLLWHFFKGRQNIPKFIIVAPCRKNGLEELKNALAEARASQKAMCFLAMHRRADQKITDRLCRLYGGIVLEGIDYADLTGLARYSEGVYSMRLHALIAAKSVGAQYRSFGNDVKLKGV